MKSRIIIKKSVICLSVLLAVVQMACNDAKLGTVDNAAYIADAEKTDYRTIEVDKEGALTELTVRIAHKVDFDTKYEVVIDELLLEEFNAKNSTNYKLLPASLITMGSEVVIPAGNTSATAFGVAITPLPEDIKKSGESYAIPVRLTNTDGRMNTLGGTSTFLLCLDIILPVSAPIFAKGTRAEFEMQDAPYILSSFTIEFKYWINAYGDNQFLFWADSPAPGGMPNRLFVRFYDGNPKGSLLQARMMGIPAQAYKNQSKLNTWQHVAYTFDGTIGRAYLDGNLENEAAMPNPTLTLARFSLLQPESQTATKVMFSEVRFWTVCRTEAQLKNNMNSVSPNSEGLEAYWKLDEGEGNIFYDATGHGNNGKPYLGNSTTNASTVTWEEDINNM